MRNLKRGLNIIGGPHLPISRGDATGLSCPLPVDSVYVYVVNKTRMVHVPALRRWLFLPCVRCSIAPHFSLPLCDPYILPPPPPGCLVIPHSPSAKHMVHCCAVYKIVCPYSETSNRMHPVSFFASSQMSVPCYSYSILVRIEQDKAEQKMGRDKINKRSQDRRYICKLPLNLPRFPCDSPRVTALSPRFPCDSSRVTALGSCVTAPV